MTVFYVLFFTKKLGGVVVERVLEGFVGEAARLPTPEALAEAAHRVGTGVKDAVFQVGVRGLDVLVGQREPIDINSQA